MMNQKFIFILVLCLCAVRVTIAAGKPVSADSAVKSYFDKHYTESASAFEELFALDNTQSNLAYNAGNAYFKSGKPGLARLYYEKALRLNPRHDDLNFNLAAVKELLKDDVTEPFGDYLRRTVFFAAIFLSVSELAVIALVVSCLFWAGAMIIKLRGKRLLGLSGFFAFVLYAYVLGTYLIKLDSDHLMRSGVVTESSVPVKASYLDRDKPLFELHEATKVQIIDEQRFGDGENWLRIELSSGQKGWVVAGAIGAI